MSEKMTNEQAIRWLHVAKGYVGGKDAVDKAPLSNRYAEGISEAVCAVEDLPSVQPSISIQITEREKYGRFN